MTASEPADKSSESNDGAPSDWEERIRGLAHQLWEADGSQEGRAEEYWRRAQEILDEEAKSNYPPARAKRDQT